MKLASNPELGHLSFSLKESSGLPGDSVVKNLPANAGDIGSIPGWGRCTGVGSGTPSSILAWKIPWT